jgi:uncharacterized protein YndB with AHSA1/START domain
MTDIAGERDVVIQAPPGQVFEYISDFSHHADWNHQILEVTQISDGPVGVGTRFRAREQTPKTVPIPMKLMFPVMLRFFGIERHTEAELTELEPGRKLAWKASASRRNGEYWMRAEWELELAGEGEGGTRVTQRFRFLPEHPRAQSMMADAERNSAVIGKEVSANLEQLKQTLESGSATAS